MALLASFHRERDAIAEFFVIGSPNVGPGTYEPRSLPTRTCTFGVGERPFQGRDARDTPGPGQYAVAQKMKAGATRSCFRSSTSRCDPNNHREPAFVPGSGWFVASTILDNPGPGGDPSPTELRPRTGGPFEHSRVEKLDWGAERAIQALKEGTRLHTETTPAIKPLRDRSDWNFTGEPGDTPDPGMYRLDCYNIGRGKREVHFAAPSDRKATWGNTNLKDNPGPGTYDHEAPEISLPRRLPGGTGGGGPALDPPGFGSDSPQTSTTFSSSRLPAVFFSSSWSPALLPGPGTYDLKSGDGKQSSSAFRSTSDRFWVPEGGARPGPGQYTQPSDLPTEKIRRARSVPDFMGRKFFGVQNPHQLRSLRETDGLMLGNWGHGPQRPSPASNRNVAPGSYNPEECMGQSISAKLRHLAKMAQGAAFGGSRYGERFQSSGIESVSPGPVLPHEEVTKAGDASGGAFKSGAPRLASPRSEEELPGPGSYDVVGKPDFRAGWRIAKRDHVSFNSSGQRFENNATDVPPPGAYELTSEEGKGCYSFKATATRGVAAPKGHHGPDPGMYNIAGSLLRKSFNTKVEETAWLLQTPSDKNRPPPRGPFPWAEGSTWRPRQVLEALALEDKTATEATERVLLQPEKSA